MLNPSIVLSIIGINIRGTQLSVAGATDLVPDKVLIVPSWSHINERRTARDICLFLVFSSAQLLISRSRQK